MPKTKVLFISGSMPPLKCGIGFYTSRLLDYMTGEFDLLTSRGMSGHGRARRNLFTPKWSLAALPLLVRKIRRAKYRIIHIQYPAKGYGRQIGINVLPYILRLITGAKLFVTLHEYHGSGILGKARNLITVLPAHRIFVSNKMDLNALPLFLRQKTIIVPIGSNVSKTPRNRKYYKSVMADAGFNLKEKTAVFFGFSFPNKGLETAIQAAHESKTQLLLLSELSDTDEYQKSLVSQINTARSRGAKLHVTGFLDDREVSEILQECDYFLLPQPLPLTAKSGTAIAAICHGLTIISTAATNPELNLPYKDGINSVLLWPMTKDRLTSTLKKLHSTQKSKSFKDGVASVANYFSWDNIVSGHQHAYKEAIGE